MTELEAYEALMLASNQAQSTGEVLLTILTGYLLIAFFIGERLTIFQVCFVNAIFLLTYVSTWQTLIEYLDIASHFREILTSLQSELPVVIEPAYSTSIFNIIMASLMTIGALYFMWTIRHPKSD